MFSQNSRSVKERSVALAGATGLVGDALLQGLLADDSVREVHVVGRRPPARVHPKLTVHVVDMRAIPPLPAVDEVYLALGTTIKAAGNRQAFRDVDYGANLAVAQAALKAGARRLGLVSAMGADAGSSIFYNRVKGELEDSLQALPFETVVIARPSLLLGDRRVLGQTRRSAENVTKVIMNSLRMILPKSIRPIEAGKVALALLTRVPTESGVHLISSAELADAS